MTAPDGSGLQPERTVLSWRRTLLAVAAGALVATRVLAPLLGDAVAALVGLGGVGAAAALWLVAGRRADRITRVFDGRRLPDAMPGGGALAVLALLPATAAALALLLVVRR